MRLDNKTFLTIVEAEKFMDENPQYDYEFTSAITEVGEEAAYVYVKDGGLHYLVLRDEIDHSEIFAFESWSTGDKFQTSALYEGQEALDFITRHEESGTFAKLHTFNNRIDAEEKLLEYQNF